ncbi:MAG: STAS/SEC14 domain-containing protein [Candidatus Komeilibacteria bacterium]|nr:STAS/SEC14 domain-containing protein [Candidatus Komeilibacteria bacterium]
MKGKVFVDSAQIVNWIPEDPTGDIEGTKLAMEVMEGIVEEQGPSLILVDLTKGQRPNALQRQIIINTIRSNMHSIKKIAIFGESALMKAVAFFVINTSGYSNMRFFSSRSQAIQWLQQTQ